ncbi:CPBP family intramembrane glutamic endopeptidase [Mesonia ostreae]|uniref:CPBP family intramembrane glutamic endopeptidase n=1 Tax=Mesonia ostreae TaxID=861110 RepID=A0ABU2KIU1_9FLAO|nr:CPBP family intramembrane glutamic endopeptidase [Mesonia ostreae]MDT0294637.1 CPBP family intramembrane glutamic endopeptidase [Mesonia ostreae]
MPKKTLKNWLLQLGIASFALLIALQILFASLGIDYPPISRDMLGEGLSFGFFVILGVIIAPLFEEVAFRGFFTAQRWLRITSFIVLLVFVGLSFSYFSLALLLLYILSVYLNDRSGKKRINLLLVMNAVLFAGIHYTANDFITSLGVVSILAQFGMGLILLWITINFGLIKAMLFHAFYNGLLIIILFMALEYPSPEKHTVESEHLTLEYKEVPYTKSNKSSFTRKDTKDTLYVSNMRLNKASRLLLKTSALPEEEEPWVESVPFMKYDLKVYTNNKEEVHTYRKELYQLLKKEELIY